jgi:hypothetical protein
MWRQKKPQKKVAVTYEVTILPVSEQVTQRPSKVICIYLHLQAKLDLKFPLLRTQIAKNCR